MERPAISLQVLSALSPILSKVEKGYVTGMPTTSINQAYQCAIANLSRGSENELILSIEQRDWLINQLPTYSLDSIDEVMAFSRDGTPKKPSRVLWQPLNCCLDQPSNSKLLNIFDFLTERYLIWHGGEVMLNWHRLGELHALGKRISLSFVVQHFHARAIACGNKSFGSISGLFDSINLLSVNTAGNRVVLERGLSENHLHLNAIHTAQTNWADSLLLPLEQKPSYLTDSDWRLLSFSQRVSRALALAVFIVRSGLGFDSRDLTILLKLLDRLYYAKGIEEAGAIQTSFDFKITSVVENILSDPSCRCPLDVDKLFSDKSNLYNDRDKFLGIFYWLDPWRCSHWQFINSGSVMASRYKPLQSSAQCRLQLFNFHLAAHLALIHATDKGKGLTYASKAWEANQRLLSYFQGCFFRYLVAQTHHWQLAVQQGTTVGLRHFRHYYASKQRRPVKIDAINNAKAVFEQLAKWKNLLSVEGRVPPPKSADKELLPWLQAYVAAMELNSCPERFGLVIHFVKSKSKINKTIEELPNLARYHHQRCEYKREAVRLFYILQQSSAVNPFIVGIDAASLELVTPPEALAPVFNFLREAPIEIRTPDRFDSISPQEQSLHRAVKRLVKQRRLGMTYHVAEEFRHLLSGLRAIDEVLEYLRPQSGDRIGHGIALGLSAKTWLQQVGKQVMLSKQEWLDTLVWVFHYLGDSNECLARLNIENRIEKLARDIYGVKERISVLQLWHIWLLRQLDPCAIGYDDSKSRIIFTPSPEHDETAWRWNRIGARLVKRLRDKVGSHPPYELLMKYWFNEQTRKQGDKVIVIDMEPHAKLWCKLCEKMQRIMVKKVSKRQLVIETNPSANVAIGPMNSMADHPLFNLCFDKHGKMNTDLKMTVNTDNPGTANTSLSHEYYLLANTMLQKGYNEDQVLQWLEWLRQCGHDASFVRHLPTADDPDMQLILAHIKATLPKSTLSSDERLQQWFKMNFSI